MRRCRTWRCRVPGSDRTSAQQRRRARRGGPIGAVAHNQPRQRSGMITAAVERRHGVEVLSAGLQEGSAPRECDFLQGLEAVSRETRTQHSHGTDAAAWQLTQAAIGGRGEPAVGAEARLETQAPVARRQVECGRQLYRSLPALIAIAVATRYVRLRYAVKRHQQMGAA